MQSGVPRHWGSVRCGCIEGVLATAILAGQHPDVWDAAGLLLREHHKYDHFGQSTVTGKRYLAHEAGLPGSIKQVCQKHGLQCWQPLYRLGVLFLEVVQPQNRPYSELMCVLKLTLNQGLSGAAAFQKWHT